MTRGTVLAARTGITVKEELPDRATEKERGEAVYRHLRELLVFAGLPLSTHFNAKYGLDAVLCILIAMCESSNFATPAIASLARHVEDSPLARVPSPRWFTGLLSAVASETMLERAGLMFGRSVEMMVERGMIPAWATVAVDMTAKPYSGKKRDEIARGGKSKGGTSWFETFATAVIASRPYLPHIGIRPVRAGDAVDKCVRGLLQDCQRFGISIRLLLPGRGFYSAAVMHLATAMCVTFIMPVPMSPPIRRAIAEFKAGTRKAISQYTVNEGTASEYTYTMIIVKRYVKKNGRRVAAYLVFATNMSTRKARHAIDKIPSEYKKRWAIETGYRSVNKARARTKSNSLSARLFLFYFTLTALNVWAMVNFGADTQRTRSGLLKRARTEADRRSAAQVRGRGQKDKLWQKYWRNVVTLDAMLDRLRMIADEMLRRTDKGRADLLAQMSAAAV